MKNGENMVRGYLTVSYYDTFAVKVVQMRVNYVSSHDVTAR